jgi:hypothetical protein
VQERLWCDHELFRWVGHAASDGTLLHHVVGPPASLIGSELPVQFGSGPLSWIETFVTFCGMVGLQAMVLGRLGMKAPLIQERVLYPAHRHLRAGARRGSGLFVCLVEDE